MPVETIQAVFLKEVIPHAFFQPDIAFLEFTPRDIARIESHRKSFYRIGDRSRSMDSMTQFPGPYVWVAGFPQEFVVPNAEVYQEEPVRLVRGGLEVAPDRYVAGSPFDYLVVRIPSGVDGAAQTYQGVSGAGVWGFYFRHDRKTGEISSEPPEFALIGVAFHEGPLEKNQREICCHGAGSIHVTLPGELQNPQT
ncbi:hypothetical protein DB347_17765 [Opitutaceae bacterium EW11]|nr:hypothetical protein DB347_17765 [Opitutaceae bacterium EW11]